jgi:hypothetical protein
MDLNADPDPVFFLFAETDRDSDPGLLREHFYVIFSLVKFYYLRSQGAQKQRNSALDPQH